MSTTNQVWLVGVQQWYDQDYEQAVETWSEALARQEEGASWSTRSASLDDVLAALDEAALVVSSCHTLQDDVHTTTTPAPLWLFLAGCYLDAQRFQDARRALLLALRQAWQQQTTKETTTPEHDGGDDDALIHRILVELIATFEEEDLGDSAPDSAGYRIAKWAIDHHHRLPSSLGWSDPYQRPGYLHPHLTSKPWYNLDDQERPDWCTILEENYETIRQDFEELYRYNPNWPRVGDGSHRDGAGQHDGSVLDGGDWREFVLFGSGESSNTGATRTKEIIRKYVPQAVSLARAGGGEVIFSVLHPNTHIQPHCGTTNLRLTAHLGLVVPEGCRIRVGEHWETWNEGKVMVFDDSYEHEVENTTDSMIRAVLLLRFWHFDLSAEEAEEALERAFRAKRNDELRRYNPPLPKTAACNSRLRQMVQQRAFGESHCSICNSSGYDSLRVQLESDYVYDDSFTPVFQCTCGGMLESHQDGY